MHLLSFNWLMQSDISCVFFLLSCTAMGKSLLVGGVGESRLSGDIAHRILCYTHPDSFCLLKYFFCNKWCKVYTVNMVAVCIICRLVPCQTQLTCMLMSRASWFWPWYFPPDLTEHQICKWKRRHLEIAVTAGCNLCLFLLVFLPWVLWQPHTVNHLVIRPILWP